MSSDTESNTGYLLTMRDPLKLLISLHQTTPQYSTKRCDYTKKPCKLLTKKALKKPK